MQGNHVHAPPIIYPEPSWISLLFPFARLTYHLLHVMFVLLRLLFKSFVIRLERRRENHLVFVFMSVAMTSCGTSETYWGMFLALECQEYVTVTGGCLKRGAQVAARRIDGRMYVLMEKKDWGQPSSSGFVSFPHSYRSSGEH